ncbi:MAG TPA: hypothetical protein VFW19_04625 [Allosphingosinicella sp.]|nr:hypothetical protein [Allosphingosinicella sp.]
MSAPLHPAERRRLAALMPPEAPHEIDLKPLGGGDGRTIIATSIVQNFVADLFETLAASDWRTKLQAMRRRRVDSSDQLQLGLPTHRQFQIALFEASCRMPGSPRLDPAKIASQGLVLRRLRTPGPQGWMKAGSKVAGWQGITEGVDPDPTKRGAHNKANAAVRTLLAARASTQPPAEDVIPLFVAPPDVCAACGRTVLFATIPVVSSERSDGAPDALDYSKLADSDKNDLREHLSEYLKARPPTSLPYAGAPLDPSVNALAQQYSDDGDQQRLYAIALFVQQVVVELGGLGQGAAARGLMALLRQIVLPLPNGGSTNAARFAADASPILLEAQPNNGGVTMPLSWPRVDDAMGERIFAAALACLTDQHAALSTSPGKFDNRDDVYQVRAFIRVRGHDDCPDRLVWSEPASEPFGILPWWDGDAPPIRIPLPDLSEIGKVRPSVAFEMPAKLANLLKGDPKKLATGEGSTDGLQLGWLCSFSIPIITLCAFIVLNIFLGLFDLIFRWMILLKICIPIPMKKSGG